MADATGVAYAYNASARPAVYGETLCAEVSSENFWAGHVGDALARSFVARLVTNDGLANVTAGEVLAASAMEGRGFLAAVQE